MAAKKKKTKKKIDKTKPVAKKPAKKGKKAKSKGETNGARGRKKVLTGLPDGETEKRMRRALRAAGFELKSCEQTVTCKTSAKGYSAKLPNGDTVDIPLEPRKRGEKGKDA